MNDPALEAALLAVALADLLLASDNMGNLVAIIAPIASLQAQASLASLPRDPSLPLEERLRQALAYFARP